MNARFLPQIVFALSVLLPAPGHGQEPPAAVWSQLYSKDTVTFAAHLRLAGFPESTVGLLVSQEINRRFEDREKQFRPSLESLQSLRDGWSIESRDALVRLRKEKNELLRASLGTVPEQTAKIDYDPPVLSGVDQATKDTVHAIVDDYGELIARLVAQTKGSLFEDDKTKLRFLYDERSADLVRVLGEEKGLDYEIYVSGFFKSWQPQLELMKPTAQEFRDLFSLRRKYGFDLEISKMSLTPRGQELRKEMQTELEKRWGSKRFAEYDRATAITYQHIYHLVVRLGKDPALADRIWDDLEQTTKSSTAIYEKKFEPLPAFRALVTAEAKRLIGEHIAFVKGLLGEAGYQDYYQIESFLIEGMQKGHVFTSGPPRI